MEGSKKRKCPAHAALQTEDSEQILQTRRTLIKEGRFLRVLKCERRPDRREAEWRLFWSDKNEWTGFLSPSRFWREWITEPQEILASYHSGTIILGYLVCLSSGGQN